MTKLSIYLLLFCSVILSAAQNKNERPSPPARIVANIDGVNITIDYSRPSLKKRKIGSDDFIPYGEVWRNGANEATWIEVSEDVLINGEVLKKGKYGFFVIPDANNWTLIFNKAWNQWGAYNYTAEKDVLRIPVAVMTSSTAVDTYTINLDNAGNGSLNWSYLTVAFNIKRKQV
jgi:archaellum component FlaF (FlaF/FlaG flagellin family)